jgi:hypothetical protein
MNPWWPASCKYLEAEKSFRFHKRREPSARPAWAYMSTQRDEFVPSLPAKEGVYDPKPQCDRCVDLALHA